MKTLLLSFALVLGLSALGCSTSVSNVSCETGAGTAAHSCADEPLTACPTGSTSVSACPTTNELGNCTVSATLLGVTASTTTYFYSDGGYATAADAETACKAEGGTWAAK
jgi:hypothetical protein